MGSRHFISNTNCNKEGEYCFPQRKLVWEYDDVIFRVTGLLWVESTGDRPEASGAELWCYLWSAPEQKAEQTIGTPVIWDAIALIMTSL